MPPASRGGELVVHGNNKDEAFLRAGGGGRRAGRARRAGRGRASPRPPVSSGCSSGSRSASTRTPTRRSARGTTARSSASRPTRRRAVVAEALERGLDVLGVHVHVGSQLADFDAQAETIVRLAVLRRELPRRARLDGAGRRPRRRFRHPPPSRPTRCRTPPSSPPSAASTARLAFVEAGLPKPEVWLEPGRSLVGRAGVTLYRVGSVKRLPERTWVAIDGGMSDNPRPQLYDARYTALSATRAGRARRRGGQRRRDALRVRRRPDRRRRAAIPAPRRPAGGARDRRLHARDGLELQRRATPGGRPRAGRRGARRSGRRETIDDLLRARGT